MTKLRDKRQAHYRMNGALGQLHLIKGCIKSVQHSCMATGVPITNDQVMAMRVIETETQRLIRELPLQLYPHLYYIDAHKQLCKRTPAEVKQYLKEITNARSSIS